MSSLMVCFVFSLQEQLDEYERIVSQIPPVLLPLMKPFCERVDEALKPGQTSLCWMSLNLDECKLQLQHVTLANTHK